MKNKFFAALVAVLLVFGFAAANANAQKAEVPHINAEAFELLMQRAEKPVLILFDAHWCPYCRAMQPGLYKLSQQKSDKLVVFRLDTDVETDLTLAYDVATLPTLIMFKQGKEVARRAGAAKEKDLFKWVEKAMKQ